PAKSCTSPLARLLPSTNPIQFAEASLSDAPPETIHSSSLLSWCPASALHTNNSPAAHHNLGGPSAASHPAGARFSSSTQSLFPTALTPPASASLSLLRSTLAPTRPSVSAPPPRGRRRSSKTPAPTPRTPNFPPDTPAPETRANNSSASFALPDPP